VDPVERISTTVRQLYERFEARLGLTWTAYRLADGLASAVSSVGPEEGRLAAMEQPFMNREGRIVRPDGRTVAWSEAGDPDGRPVLRVPGTPGSRFSVRSDQSPWIERGLRMLTTERPGFGASTRLAGRRFVEPADDLAAILDELDIADLPVYGGSGAAPHILAFAARHPARTQAATIVVGAAPIDDDEAGELIGLNAEGYRLAKARDRDGMVRLLTPVRESMLADPLGSFRAVMETAPPLDQEIMNDPAWQESLVRGLTEAIRPGVEGWVDESMLMFAAWPDIDLAAIRTSLTWWHGDHDLNAPLSAVERLLEQLTHASLVVWPDAGHLMPHRHEAEILDELLARAGPAMSRPTAAGSEP
jgi:pimeloyl-ACP methyl ester carboxylesterase